MMIIFFYHERAQNCQGYSQVALMLNNFLCEVYFSTAYDPVFTSVACFFTGPDI